MPVNCGPSHNDRERNRGTHALFVRIDDFGALTCSMHRAIDILLAAGVRLHIAVVPVWLTADGARFLDELRRIAPSSIEIGQHGYRHTERRDGHRRFEVGPGMSAAEQRTVIAHGRSELQLRLGFQPSPVFVPPFNGYDQITAMVVAELGFRILSAEDRQPAIHFPAKVRELSCNVDTLASYFPPQLKDVTTILKEIEVIVAHASHIGILLHPDLISLPSKWVQYLAEGLVCDGRYQSFTLCGMAEAMDAGKLKCSPGVPLMRKM